MTLLPWTVQDSKQLIDDRWYKLRADRCETANGFTLDPYYVCDSSNWCHIAAFDEEDRILLTRQYRHGHREIAVELPCGMIEKGEEPKLAIQRELREETGAVVETLYSLPPTASNLARDSNTVYPFVGTGLRIVAEQKLDPAEEIEFFLSSIPDLLSMIDRGQFKASMQIGTIFLALRKLGLLTIEAADIGTAGIEAPGTGTAEARPSDS